jgi:RNA polymerase sigma-70 factor (ECF subfamily)
MSFPELGPNLKRRASGFERLYAEHADSLFSFFAYRTGDRALADDLLADTFERVLRCGRTFDPSRGSEKTWLYAIARNLLRDHVRRRLAEVRAIENFACSSPGERSNDATVTVEARESLGCALAALSAAEREAVSLRFGGDLKLREIAQVTQEPTTTVESRIYRALEKLRDFLDRSPEEEYTPARRAAR